MAKKKEIADEPLEKQLWKAADNFVKTLMQPSISM